MALLISSVGIHLKHNLTPAIPGFKKQRRPHFDFCAVVQQHLVFVHQGTTQGEGIKSTKTCGSRRQFNYR